VVSQHKSEYFHHGWLDEGKEMSYQANENTDKQRDELDLNSSIVDVICSVPELIL